MGKSDDDSRVLPAVALEDVLDIDVGDLVGIIMEPDGFRGACGASLRVRLISGRFVLTRVQVAMRARET